MPHQQAFKAATRERWDQAAPGWNGHAAQIRAWLSRATEAMLDMAAIKRRSRVLDVAAGAGDQTLDIAERVGPEGFVLATDLSPAIVALAYDNVRSAGHEHVQTQVAEGLREMHRALRPGGGVCTMVFAKPEQNPCITIVMSTALEHAGLAPRDPYQPGGLLSLGEPGLIDEMFKAAGFSEVATTTIDAPFKLPSTQHYLRFIRSSASPIQQILGKLDAAGADAAWAEMEQRLAGFTTAAGWEGPNELLLTAARR